MLELSYRFQTYHYSFSRHLPFRKRSNCIINTSQYVHFKYDDYFIDLFRHVRSALLS